jgi:mRNA-degrading endonuclease RelE of RelBE toxin-antitoxin system
MYNLEIHKKAKETLDFFKKKNLKELKNVIIALDEIVDN